MQLNTGRIVNFANWNKNEVFVPININDLEIDNIGNYAKH